MNLTELIARTPDADERLIRIAPYCRVSSDSADQLHSFAAQIRYYTEFAKSNPRYHLVDVYADEGVTGTSMEKRDEFNRLIRDCRKGKVDRVITKSVSRFARNTEELLTVIRMLKECGVSIYFEEQGIDTDCISNEMIVTFPGMAAQQESETISKNLRWGIRKRMQTGEYIGSGAPFGYRLVNGQLVICEEEAQTVRRIFDLCLQGYGKLRIARLLNAEKIPRRDGENTLNWCQDGVSYILKNERYIGDALLQKQYTTDTLPFRQKKNRGEREQYYIENAHEPIISRELFETVQTLLRERDNNAGNRTSSKSRRTVLGGMMKCPDCGRNFRRILQNGTAYWVCSARIGGIYDCAKRRVKEDEIFYAFTILTAKLKHFLQPLLGTAIRQMEMLLSETREGQDAIAEIDRKTADLTAQNLVLAKLHCKGILPAADFAVQSTDIGNRISELRAKRRKLLTEDSGDEALEELRELYRAVDSAPCVGIFDVGLLEGITKRITVQDNEHITFHLLGDISLTEQIREKGRCRAQ